MNIRTTNSYLAQRPLVLGLAKVLFLSLGRLPLIQAAPLLARDLFSSAEEPKAKDPDDPSLWIYLTFAAILVLLGGAFAGLTIALMGQVSARTPGA
jgi:metal transporter CNNM